MSARKVFQLIYAETGEAIATLHRAEGFFEKGVGLLGTVSLAAKSGLWLPKVTSIHTIGMFYAIDVLFLDDALRATKVLTNVGFGRVCLSPAATKHCVELAPGTLAHEHVRAPMSRWRIEEVN